MAFSNSDRRIETQSMFDDGGSHPQTNVHREAMSLLHQYSELVNKDASKNKAANPGALAHDMSIFESQMGGKRQGDVSDTYSEVHRLLDTPSKIVEPSEKLEIAADIIHRAAYPTESNQGGSNDCAAAGLENRLYSRKPAQAAKLVTDTVLTGQFSDSLSRKVTVSDATIADHDPALKGDDITYKTEQRNQGDRIMQAIIRNADYALKDSGLGETAGDHGLKYEIGAPTEHNHYGEYIRDYSQNPPQDVSTNNQGMSSDLPYVYSGLTSMFEKSGFEFSDPTSTGLNVEQFKQKLEALKGQYPLLMAVNPNEPPFALVDRNRKHSNYLHDITVEDYDSKTGMISFRNPEQGSQPGTISAAKMFDAMRSNQDDPNELKIFAGELKEHKAELVSHPERGADYLTYVLNSSESDQRTLVLKKLEDYTGMNLRQYLSNKQLQELGVSTDTHH